MRKEGINLILRNCKCYGIRYNSFYACQNTAVSKGSTIKGRLWLAGSNGENMPTHLNLGTNKYFSVVKTDPSKYSNIEELAKNFREHIEANLVESKFSAILFKNLPIKCEKDFDLLIKHTELPQMEYISGNASRAKVTGDTYEASNEPENLSIDLHNEMCYLDRFPRRIFFCCITPPTEDGETPIAFNRDIMDGLDKAFMEKVEQKGIRYIRNYGNKELTDYMTWQDIFNTTSRETVEQYFRNENSDWKWKEDGSVTSWYVKSPVIYHPETGEKIWFNQLVAAHNTYYKEHPSYANMNIADDEHVLHTTYGDGEEFEPKYIQHLRDVAWKCALGFRWEQGSVIVLDNLLAQHGRMSYKGQRKIVVSLTNQITRQEVQKQNKK